MIDLIDIEVDEETIISQIKMAFWLKLVSKMYTIYPMSKQTLFSKII